MCGAPPLVWAKQFGGTAADKVYDMAATADGGVVVVGSFSGSVNFGGGVVTSQAGADAFVVKLDRDGNHVWSRTYGDPTPQDSTLRTERALAVAVRGDGHLVVAGEVQGDSINFGAGTMQTVLGDAFLLELDGDGILQQVDVFTGSDNGSTFFASRRIEALAVDSAGGVVLGGGTRWGLTIGGVTVGDGGSSFDGFLYRLDAGLSHVFSNFLDDGGFVNSVAVAPDGDVVACGEFALPITIGGMSIVPAGSQDGFIARLNATGQAEWVKSLGSSGASCESVDVALDGRVVAGGSFAGAMDLGNAHVLTAGANGSGFVVSYAADGSTEWAEQVDGESGGLVREVSVDTDGFASVWGWFGGSGSFAGITLTSAGAEDFFLARLGPSGGVAFLKELGGSNSEDSPIALQTSNGSIFLSGEFTNTLTLDGTTLVPMGSTDLFVARFGAAQ